MEWQLSRSLVVRLSTRRGYFLPMQTQLRLTVFARPATSAWFAILRLRVGNEVAPTSKQPYVKHLLGRARRNIGCQS